MQENGGRKYSANIILVIWGKGVKYVIIQQLDYRVYCGHIIETKIFWNIWKHTKNSNKLH